MRKVCSAPVAAKKIRLGATKTLIQTWTWRMNIRRRAGFARADFFFAKSTLRPNLATNSQMQITADARGGKLASANG